MNNTGVKCAIITVLGTDCVGIIARVSNALADANVNIMDINQTTMQDVFAMTMLVDYSKMNIEFNEMRARLDEVAGALGVEIRMQRREIFDAMHRI